jgi:hypothetical protein
MYIKLTDIPPECILLPSESWTCWYDDILGPKTIASITEK